MKIAGFEGLKSHLPDYSDKQIKMLVARLPGIAILSLLIALTMDYLMRGLYNLTPWQFFVKTEPWIPLVIPLIFVFGGTKVAQRGFVIRNRLREEYGQKSYQQVAKVVFTGIPMVFGGLLYGLFAHDVLGSSLNRAFNSGKAIANEPLNPLTTIFSESITGLFSDITWDFYIRAVIGGVILIIAIGSAVRAVLKFGVDTASLVYVYFPEDAKVIQNEIYSVVRHPMYMAAYLVSLAGFCFQFSVYSIAHFAITSMSFFVHIKYFEEKELIERFGESYEKYQNRVPAVFIRLKNWGKLLSFIFGKKQGEGPKNTPDMNSKE